MLFGVVALPVLLPIAGLLQLLFPGLLREQWRQYKYVVHVLLTQSTVIFIHWALATWVFDQLPWWMGDKYLWIALVAIAAGGAVLAWVNTARPEPVGDEPPPPPTFKKPVSLEYWAVGVMAAVGVLWVGWQLLKGEAAWDHLAVVTIAAVAAFGHLIYRKLCWTDGRPMSGFHLTTQRVMLTTLAVAGVAVGLYVYRADANQVAGAVTSEWITFRANMERTGATSPTDAGPKSPRILWTFDPGVKKGRVIIDSSPTVVDGQVYVGALYNLSTTFAGYVYCINATDGRMTGDKPVPLGERLWTFDAGNTLQGVFSSPTVVGGRLYFGEGFHQDKSCRLFCLDASDATKTKWTKTTTSHVESSPTVVGERIYFGAGDDGVFCLELPKVKPADGESAEPKEVWHFEKFHVDSSPTVAGNRVYVGSILGDIHQEFAALCLDGDKGNIVWRIPAPAPIPSAPVAVGDSVYFALGNGKLNQPAEKPIGAVWKLNAKDGKQEWEFLAEGSIFASPLVKDDHVFSVSTDAFCYCLNGANGKVVWKTFLSKPLVACPILAGGKLYAQTVGGTLYCLKADTGDIVWTFNEITSKDESAYASPTLVGGRIYTAIDGKVYCIGD